jgi:hypothetical protein
MAKTMTAAKKNAGLSFDKATGYPFATGDSILIRTVTMYQVGRVVSVGPDSITLDEASWVADLGRLGEALASGKLLEVEKVPAWVTVGRGAIVDIYPWAHALPDSTK